MFINILIFFTQYGLINELQSQKIFIIRSDRMFPAIKGTSITQRNKQTAHKRDITILRLRSGPIIARASLIGFISNESLPSGYGRWGEWFGSCLASPTLFFSALINQINRKKIYWSLGKTSICMRTLPMFFNFPYLGSFPLH